MRIINNVTIVGAGSLGKIVVSLLEPLIDEPVNYDFYDDEKTGKVYNGKIKGTVDDLIEKHGNKTHKQVIIAIGNIEARKNVYKKIQSTSLDLIVAVDNSVQISEHGILLGDNNIIKENTVIEHEVKIGDNNVIGNNTTICHDTVIGDHCRISPGVTICGNVEIGDEVYLGPGVTVNKDITIDDKITVASGTNVYKDVYNRKVHKDRITVFQEDI